MSGRLAKWAVELGAHDLLYTPRTAVKGQVLADFLVENPEVTEQEILAIQQDKYEGDDTNHGSWSLYTDGASSAEGSGAGLVFIDPNGTELTYAMRLAFPSTNNEAEYEALLAGLRIAGKLEIHELEIYVDSMLIANQINGEYEAKEESMRKYLQLAKNLLDSFRKSKVTQVPRSKNKKADALSKLASLTFAHLTKSVLVEVVKERSIEEKEVHDVVEESRDTWMTPLIEYLSKGELPPDKDRAHQIRAKAAQYTLEGGILYKKAYMSPLLRCVGPAQSSYLIKEVHMGICGTHAGPRSVVTKLMNLGYFWPTMHSDATAELQRCEGCQIHAPVQRAPKNNLIPIWPAWPFYKWGMDIVGPFPEAAGRVKFLLVAVDYFTKWIEVRPLAKITGKQVIKFVWESIICRFGLPGVIVTDNGRQFAENPFKTWCESLEVKQVFSSVAHPQSNGQVERTNRSIVAGLKARLGRKGKDWVDELPSVVWALRTTEKTSHGRSPFSLTYGSEAVIPAEIGIHTYRVSHQQEEENEKELLLNLDLLEEHREEARLREVNYKKKMEEYYNKRVRGTQFLPGDLVLRRNAASHKEPGGKMGPTWEGPYKVAEAHNKGSYKLTTIDGKPVPRHWNLANLKKFYV